MRTAAALAAAASIAALAGCGGGSSKGATGDGRPPLAWKAPPQAYRPADLPNDRVVLAAVRNVSDKPVQLDAAKLVVRDADGHVLRSSGRYIAGYAHGLYGAFQKPDPLPPDELKRMGIRITLQPGRTAPVYVAWRLGSGSRGPATVDLGPARLKLPSKAVAGQ